MYKFNYNNGTSIEENGLIGFWNFDLSVEDLINNNEDAYQWSKLFNKYN